MKTSIAVMSAGLGLMWVLCGTMACSTPPHQTTVEQDVEKKEKSDIRESTKQNVREDKATPDVGTKGHDAP
ncbi:MAG: hypothetical protein COV67_08400 [Nitrospinae bacterium CG11_big_fil_rev_8_21_14_0_20_56_8]|nr:MAG: hypothetical protein COV67_08400 [Nitrospinae bacterium CG11_big_fil_rev_8_21_14_0_20_56_8]